MPSKDKKYNPDPKFPSLEEYLVQGEPEQRERAANWATAIGLQAVDGLKTSDYLQVVALRNVEGEIDIDEARNLISRYYQEHGESISTRTQEADKVGANIAKILGEKTITLSSEGLASIHRQIFGGVFEFAGQLRTVNITKPEWVLDGDTVLYSSYIDLKLTLDYDISQEKAFSYRGLNQDQILDHISHFVAGIWQIHPFREGNTRTTAVFTIKYLHSLGFKADNTPFEQNAKYFRDALARANYRNAPKGIDYDFIGLTRFFSNLLYATQYPLKKRYLHVDAPKNGLIYPPSTPQVPPEYPPSTPQVELLVKGIGEKELSAKEIRELLSLKDRKHFNEAYLGPAIEGGWIKMLYPDKPKSSRQKYLLTVKGLTLFSQLKKQKS